MKVVDADFEVVKKDIEKLNEVLKRILKPEKRNFGIKNINKYDYDYLLSKISSNNKKYIDIIIEYLLTTYLTGIHNLKLSNDYKLDHRVYDDKFEYIDMTETIEFSEQTAVDLVYLAIGRNDRYIYYPIKFDFIKTYSMPSCLKKENTNEYIWYLLLYVANCHFDLCKTNSKIFN